MPPIKLTEGAVAAMLNRVDSNVSDAMPVMQVADIRLVNTQTQNSERYRLLLSDGSFTQQGMLATQLNHLAKSGKLQKNSIVQLKQFVCNIIQNRVIVIILDMDVIVEICDTIGEPKLHPCKTDGNASSNTGPSTVGQPLNQQAAGVSNSSSYNVGSAARSNVEGGVRAPPSGEERHPPSHTYGSSVVSNMDSARYNSANTPQSFPKPEYGFPKPEYGSGVSRSPVNNYVRPPQSSYHQPSPMFANRGPIARNEAPPRIIPIAALNPYQGRWTIKARVTTKGELRRYNNSRGDGKVFSFDLLDSDGGEIRATCFNAVADQFYHQIEPGKVYMISRGTLKPAQKNFNHLPNDHEIFLDNTSTVQPCFEDDTSIPQQQFHFRPISAIEALENNVVVDLLGVVSSVSPSSSIRRKDGTETQKRTLQLKDMSGRSVELTLWGNFANAEGQTLQNKCDSGVFPVLVVKSVRVNDFNGKSVGTISTSQLFIDPDSSEAQNLRTWFDNEGKSTPTVSISREMNVVRTDVRKTVSQIKDEKLGTSEKPDYITVCATVAFLKAENFYYTACPLMVGDRQCNKKVTNNGDGKWNCDRCGQLVDECDYRYILQMQIQDHTGIIWVTAFQESGEEIMGVPAKQLYIWKHEEQDDEKFAEVIRSVLLNKFLFKLKVKEETVFDEQRVKSTVLKTEKMNFQKETKYLLDLIPKFKEGDGLMNTCGLGSGSTAPANNYIETNSNPARQTSQMASYGNPYDGSKLPSTSSTGMYVNCSSCGGAGHNAANCPSLMSGPGSYGSTFGSKVVNPGPSSGSVSGQCFKCNQPGHWARDCPGTNNVPPAYGSNGANPGRYGMVSNQRVGGF